MGGPTYCRRARLPFRRLGEQTIILNPRARDVHVLNRTGSLIWELMGEAHSAEELAHLLNGPGPFDAGLDEMTADIEQFLVELRDKDLVEVKSPLSVQPGAER